MEEEFLKVVGGIKLRKQPSPRGNLARFLPDPKIRLDLRNMLKNMDNYKRKPYSGRKPMQAAKPSHALYPKREIAYRKKPRSDGDAPNYQQEHVYGVFPS